MQIDQIYPTIHVPETIGWADYRISGTLQYLRMRGGGRGYHGRAEGGPMQTPCDGAASGNHLGHALLVVPRPG